MNDQINTLQLVSGKRYKRLVIKDSNEKLENLQLTTGIVYLPFGVSNFTNKWSEFCDYSISCYVEPEFETICDTIDNIIQENIAKDNKYYPALRVNKDYPKLFKINLPRDKNGNFDFVVFDSDGETKNQVTEDNIEQVFGKRNRFKCLIECTRVYEQNGSAGSVWSLLYCKKVQGEQEIDNLIYEDATKTSTKDLYTTCQLD